MSRVLITLWDGGGNSPPVLGLAASLIARGHAVRVLADQSLAEAVSRSGADHVPWTLAPQRQSNDPRTEFVRDYEPRTPVGAVGRLRDRLIAGPAAEFMHDTRTEIDRFAPDVVLIENLLLGSQLAAEASGVPYASLVPNIYPGRVPGVPPFGMGLTPRDDTIGRVRDRIVKAVGTRLWDHRLTELNGLRASVGLSPVASLFDLLEDPEKVLVLTSAAFELDEARNVPPQVVYCGPQLEDPDWAAPWVPPVGDAPLVLASLSTTTQDQYRTLPRVVAALGQLPVRGLVTTGPSAVLTEAGPANVTVVPSAPHTAVLKHASVTISHGGHGTVIKSLAAGVPVVCLPVSRDQPDTAARVVAAGAGVRISPRSGPRAIVRAVTRVLADQEYTRAAARIGQAIASDVARGRAVEEIEALARTAATAPSAAAGRR